MYPSSIPSGFKRRCSPCRVDRHDRCIGPMDCGCQDPAHRSPETPDPAEGDSWSQGAAIEIDGEMLNVLAATAEAQDRSVDIVVRRALEHYLGCQMSNCTHMHDARTAIKHVEAP